MQFQTEDLLAILPFIVAMIGGLFVVLLDSFASSKAPRGFLGGFALVFFAAMLVAQLIGLGTGPQTAFFDMVVADDFSRFVGVVLIIAAALSILIAIGRLPREEGTGGEFYALALFATGGACLLTQAVDMVALFVGLECLSIPAYILAASLRRDPRSVEAGFKYFILGAFSTGFLVFGTALLYGASGSTQFAEIAASVTTGAWVENVYLVIGSLMVLTGLCFKIGAVPFHMWAPDVYQGSPTAATAYFATVVKAAAFAALLRVLFVALPEMRIGLEGFEGAGWLFLMQAVAVLTMSVANLVALVQRNVKRILAYSSIAHAGYLIIGLLTETDGAAAILFYLAAYSFMTVGAFALVAYFEGDGRGTSLDDFAGLGRRHPVAAASLSVFLFSLAGIPPTVGFFAKFYLFKVAIEYDMVPLVVIAVLNSLVSAFYYLRIMVALYMREGRPEASSVAKPAVAIAFAVAICLLFVIGMGIFPTPYIDLALASVATLL
jgi:NADH-quinone oxidoreductase subunit N